jgi:ribosomal silencing factor RsfS
MKKVVIYPKDIMILTGRSERHSRKLLQKIKSTLKKGDHQLVTVEEVCAYFGIPVEVALSALKS